MKENINIADILKDKPKTTKLYADAFGELTIVDICILKKIGITLANIDGKELCFYNDGKYYIHGEPILFPSKEMRDWSKFAWKKGDVLVSEGMGRLHVIFEGFDDDTYTTFKGKHYLCNYDDNEDYHKELILRTIEFKKDNVNDAKAYINTIEERFGGQLNFETLEIKKAQPKVELKSLDMVLVRDYKDSEWYFDTFESMVPNCIYPYKCMINLWKYCIPYKGNEHLLGTTKDVEG